MSNISNYFEQAELAFAAYSDLTPLMIIDEYEAALKKDTGAEMTAAQAYQFALTWRVVDQYNDPNTGLSATIFQKADGTTSLAIRGTDDLLDLSADYAIFIGDPSELSAQYLSLKAQVQTWLADPQVLQGKNFTVTVTVTGNAGRDTIIDVDGLGQLVINNQSLTTGSAFLSRDGSFGRMAA